MRIAHTVTSESVLLYFAKMEKYSEVGLCLQTKMHAAIEHDASRFTYISIDYIMNIVIV